MPISLEPNKRFDVVLDSDIDKPSGQKPTFHCASQTMRGHLAILETLDKWFEDGVTPAQLFDATIAELNRVIVGWSAMGSHVFGQTDLRDVLTYEEAREVLRKVAYNVHMTIEEKKS